jgi:hypothetical protein
MPLKLTISGGFERSSALPELKREVTPPLEQLTVAPASATVALTRQKLDVVKNPIVEGNLPGHVGQTRSRDDSGCTMFAPRATPICSEENGAFKT